MTEPHYQLGEPRIDRQGITLVLVVAVLTLVLTITALWVGLR
jgi:hypothetical protein